MPTTASAKRARASIQAPVAERVTKSWTPRFIASRISGRGDEMDEFREAVIAAHERDWRLLAAAAQTYQTVEHYGYLVAGKFTRPPPRRRQNRPRHRPRPRPRPAAHRSRRCRSPKRTERARRRPAELPPAVRPRRSSTGDTSEAWRLQSLTDLDKLPDYDEGWGYYGSGPRRPGRRRRQAGLLRRARKLGRRQDRRRALALGARDDGRVAAVADANEERIALADFLESQFGVQTMADFGRAASDAATTTTRKTTGATCALHTLGEDETIARLATGIKRFKLPDEFNFIKIYQQIARRQPRNDDRAIRRDRRSAAWRRSSRTAGSIRARPSTGGRPSSEYGDRQNEYRAAGSTRSSATGAASKASMTQPAGQRRDGRVPLPQRQEGQLRGPARSRSTSCSPT